MGGTADETLLHAAERGDAGAAQAALDEGADRERGLPPVQRPAAVPFVPRTPQEALLLAIYDGDLDGARRALDRRWHGEG